MELQSGRISPSHSQKTCDCSIFFLPSLLSHFLRSDENGFRSPPSASGGDSFSGWRDSLCNMTRLSSAQRRSCSPFLPSFLRNRGKTPCTYIQFHLAISDDGDDPPSDTFMGKEGRALKIERRFFFSLGARVSGRCCLVFGKESLESTRNYSGNQVGLEVRSG